MYRPIDRGKDAIGTCLRRRRDHGHGRRCHCRRSSCISGLPLFVAALVGCLITSVNELSPNRVIQTSIRNPEKLEVESKAKVRSVAEQCIATSNISHALISSNITTSTQQHHHQHRYRLLHEQRMSTDNNNDTENPTQDPQEQPTDGDPSLPSSLRPLVDSTGTLPTQLSNRTRSGRTPATSSVPGANPTLQNVTQSQQSRQRSSSDPTTNRGPSSPISPLNPRNMSAATTFTAADKQAAFTHVLTSVFALTSTDTLYRGLTESGLKTIVDLISITDITINGITYRTTSGNNSNNLNVQDKGTLYAFRQWMAHRRANGMTTSTLAEWTALEHHHSNHQLLYRSGEEFRQPKQRNHGETLILACFYKR